MVFWVENCENIRYLLGKPYENTRGIHKAYPNRTTKVIIGQHPRTETGGSKPHPEVGASKRNSRYQKEN
jgi:hypothetical protein